VCVLCVLCLSLSLRLCVSASPTSAGYFLTKIYHPNVSEAGDICVNALKKDWKPDLGIAHVLKVIWCLLLVPFPESSLNAEAGKLFMESYGEYVKKARIWTKVHALKSEVHSENSGASTASGKSGGLAPKELNAENQSPHGSGGGASKSGAKKAKKKGTKKKTKTLKRL